MALNGWKLVEMGVNGLQWLDIAENEWTLMEIAKIGCKWVVMSGNG